MKKITKILGSIGLALVLLLGIGALFGAFDDEVADLTDGAMADNTRMMVETEDGRLVEVKTNDEEVEERSETEEEQLAKDESEPSTPSDSYYHVGDMISYNDGAKVTIGNVGILQNQIYVMVLYMEMEIENASDETFDLGNGNFTLYIDDYQIETIATTLNADDTMQTDSVSVNPGRKGRCIFRTVLPDDYDNSSKIEIGFPGTTKTLLVKDDGVYLYGQKEAPAESSDTSSSGSGLSESWFEDGDLYNIDDQNINLTFAPINNSWGPAAEVYIKDSWYQYLLYMEDERNGYLTYMEGEERVGTLSFTMDGVVVDCGIPEIDGTYWY